MRLIDADALIEFCAERWIPLNIDAVNMQPTIQPVATDICVGDTISRQALCEYALNQKDKSVSPNDIMRFPSAQPEPTDIDAKEAVYNLAEKIGIHQLFALTVELRGEPIQPEPHEGRFERKRDGVFCSVCHYGWEFITGVPVEVEREYHYCPNCGARMKGEQDGH